MTFVNQDWFNVYLVKEGKVAVRHPKKGGEGANICSITDSPCAS